MWLLIYFLPIGYPVNLTADDPYRIDIQRNAGLKPAYPFPPLVLHYLSVFQSLAARLLPKPASTRNNVGVAVVITARIVGYWTVVPERAGLSHLTDRYVVSCHQTEVKRR